MTSPILPNQTNQSQYSNFPEPLPTPHKVNADRKHEDTLIGVVGGLIGLASIYCLLPSSDRQIPIKPLSSALVKHPSFLSPETLPSFTAVKAKTSFQHILDYQSYLQKEQVNLQKKQDFSRNLECNTGTTRGNHLLFMQSVKDSVDYCTPFSTEGERAKMATALVAKNVAPTRSPTLLPSDTPNEIPKKCKKIDMKKEMERILTSTDPFEILDLSAEDILNNRIKSPKYRAINLCGLHQDKSKNDVAMTKVRNRFLQANERVLKWKNDIKLKDKEVEENPNAFSCKRYFLGERKQMSNIPLIGGLLTWGFDPACPQPTAAEYQVDPI